MEAEIGSRAEDLRRGEVQAIKSWLGERVHRHGRRLDTIPLLEQATGRGMEIEPFLRYASSLTA
jgi:carboxypeptidase Taq